MFFSKRIFLASNLQSSGNVEVSIIIKLSFLINDLQTFIKLVSEGSEVIKKLQLLLILSIEL